MTTEQVLSGELREAVLASFTREPRRTRVQRLMADHSLDCLVVVGKQYATWLTGYSRYFAGISATVVGPSGDVELVTSPDEAAVAERESTAARVWTYGTGGFGLDLDPLSSLLSSLTQVAAVKKASRIGVAGLPISALSGRDLEGLTDVNAAVEAEILVKDRDEAEKVGASYNLCLAAQRAVADGVAEGASELELFHAGPLDGTAPLRGSSRLHLRSALGPPHGGGVLPDRRSWTSPAPARANRSLPILPSAPVATGAIRVGPT